MKLEDIPKKQVFDVPEGYFDDLAQRVQKRVSSETNVAPSFISRYRLQYAIPVVVLLTVGIMWFSGRGTGQNAESILATVETSELISYLNESDLSTEDLIQLGNFTTDDAEQIETEVYDLQLGDEEMDEMIEQLDIDSI